MNIPDEILSDILVRVGKKNPNYPERSKNPYSYHEWISTTKLKLELSKILDVRNHTRDDFPYYLMLFEFVPRAKKDIWYPFKYIGLMDIELQVEGKKTIKEELEKYYAHFIQNWTDKEIAMWYTGNKGYRMGFPEINKTYSPRSFLVYTGMPKEEYNEHVEANLEFFLQAYWKSTRCDFFDQGERKRLLGRYVDYSIYVPGHGVKADILPHAKTGNDQYWLSNFQFKRVDLEMPPRKGSHTTTAPYTASKIIEFWLDVINGVESRFAVDGQHFAEVAEKYPKRPDHFKTDISLNKSTQKKMIAATTKKSYDLGDLPLMKCLGSLCILRTKSTSGSELFCFDDRYCPIHEKEHSIPKHYYVLSNVRATSVVCFCHSNSTYQSGKLIPLKEKKQYFKEQQTEGLENPFLDELDRLGLLHMGSYIPLKQEYLGDILEDSRVKNKKYIFLESGMGTGKTESVAQFLEDHTNFTSSRVGASSARICFSNAVSDRWNLKSYAEFGQEKNFSEQKKNLASFNRICISMESLEKLATPGTKNIIPFDIWILDESETLLSGFNSETMDHRRRNFLTFINILKATKHKVFIMDAFMGSKTLNFFKSSGILTDPNDYVFIQNFQNKDQANWEILTPPEWPHFLQWMHFDLMNKKKIALVCDSKKQIVKIVNHLIDESKKKGQTFEWLMITGSSDDATKSTSIDCSSWSAFDLIAYTPAITVGNSCSIPFWKVYGNYHGIVNARTFLQMMSRLRDIISKQRVVLVDTTKKNKPLLIQSKEEIENYLRKKDLNIMKEAQYLIEEGFTCLDTPFLALPNPNKCLKELFIENCYEDIKSQMDPVNELKNSLTQTHANWDELNGSPNDTDHDYKQFKRDKIDLTTVNIDIKDNQLKRQYKEQLQDLYFKHDHLSTKTTSELFEILEDHNHISGKQLFHHFLLSHYEEIEENLFLQQLEERLRATDLGSMEIIQYGRLMRSIRKINKRIELIGTNKGDKFVVDLFSLQKDKSFYKKIANFFENTNNLKLWNFDAKIYFDPDETSCKRRLHTYFNYVLPFFGIFYEKVPEKTNAEFISKNKIVGCLVAKKMPKFQRNAIYFCNLEKLTNTQFIAFRKHSIADAKYDLHLKSKYRDFLREKPNLKTYKHAEHTIL